MPSRKTKNKNRKSTARKRAAEHSTGFSNTIFKNLPEGIHFFDPSPGVYRLDIVPFTAGEGNRWAPAGELHWEKTFWKYKNIGPDEDSYVAPAKTYKKPDPIKEYRDKMVQDPGHDKKAAKALLPKERQAFLVYDHGDAEKGLQLWETSYHTFGKLLDKRIDNSDPRDEWEFFYYPDEGGCTLRVEFSEEDIGVGKPWVKATAIDFKDRDKDEVIPKEIMAKAFCLDDCLNEVSYEELKSIFLQTGDDDDDEDAGGAPFGEVEEEAPEPPKKTKAKKPKPEPEPEPEDEDEAEEEAVGVTSGSADEDEEEDDWDW